ncbi:sugar ABC transporter permease [Thermopolyspora sp. NPDC052614]|uniref:sugar ABC transporter permease n=1 Tax=Thermopolyspora sp. NPDC052614 TaxID=3155682 RepID=UPI003436954D
MKPDGTSSERALLFEAAPLLDTRVPARWHRRARWRPWTYLLFAAVLVGGVLVAPLVATAVASLTEEDGPANYRAVLADPEIRQALVNNVIWLLLAVLVCAAGLGLALLARNLPPRTRAVLTAALALPAVISPLTAGIAFRLIFDTNPGRGVVNAVLPGQVLFLGPGWIWLVLGSAFVWQWTGVAFLVFQAGLPQVPADLRRVARVLGVGPLRRLRLVEIPALFPTAALAFLIVLTAAARVFDIVLIGAPGAVQSELEVVGLTWWRRQDLGPGRSSALAFLQFAVAAAVALAVLWRLRGELPGRPGGSPPPPPPPSPSATRLAHRVLALAAAVLWAAPFGVLLLTSWRSSEAVATSGPWAGGYGPESYADAFADGTFAEALAGTAVRAVFVVVIVLVAAVLAAYGLTHARVPHHGGRATVVVLTALAVLPPQVIARPLGAVLGQWVGGVVALSVVYAALMLPLAVLVLRNAFATVRAPVVARPLAEGRSAVYEVVLESGPAVVAVAVLAFVLAWNDLVVGLFLSWPAANQVPLVLLQQARQFSTGAGTLAAEAVVASAVPMLLAVLTARVLVRGLTQGVRR